MNTALYKKVIDFCHYPSNDLTFTSQSGMGFIDSQFSETDEIFFLPELNSGLSPQVWLENCNLFELNRSNVGIHLSSLDENTFSQHRLPLIFKQQIPKSGIYKVMVTLTALDADATDVLIFIGPRKLIEKIDHLSIHESTTIESVIVLNEIIPRGKTIPYQHFSVDLSIFGQNIALTSLSIESIEIPTLFIAGDSTVTDQNTVYPYMPGASYCGWGQMLPYFFYSALAISNQAHSGLTTESFKSEGHFAIIENNIRPGDIVLFQFAHNDQKLPHLQAFKGYKENLEAYIKTIKAHHALPILVSPIGRNTWKSDGSYNDLLEDYAKVCRCIAKAYDIPCIDLHAFSTDFINKKGILYAQRFFFPKDYTHSNDFGGLLMAQYIAGQCSLIPALETFVNKTKLGDLTQILPLWTPPKTIVVDQPPKEFTIKQTMNFNVNFDDLALLKTDKFSNYYNAIVDLTKSGVISNQLNSFHPFEEIKRIDAFDWLVKTVRFVPTNVYNDHFVDVLGHEWYAGLVEVIVQNDLLKDIIPITDHFSPEASVDHETFIALCIRCYLCRKPFHIDINDPENVNESIFIRSEFVKSELITFTEANNKAIRDFIRIASHLNLIDKNFVPNAPLTRCEAALYLASLDVLLS